MRNRKNYRCVPKCNVTPRFFSVAIMPGTGSQILPYQCSYSLIFCGGNAESAVAALRFCRLEFVLESVLEQQ